MIRKAITVLAVAMGATFMVAPIAHAADPVISCDQARAAYDAVVEKVKARATELGLSAEEQDRLRKDVEEKSKDGVIDDNETLDLLSDPVVVRVRGQFKASDLDLLKDLGSTSNALLRCDPGTTTVTATQTASASATTSAAATESATQTQTASATASASQTATSSASATTSANNKADFKCADFANQAAAQKALDENADAASALDANGDGKACEDVFKSGQVVTVPQGSVETGDGSLAS